MTDLTGSARGAVGKTMTGGVRSEGSSVIQVDTEGWKQTNKKSGHFTVWKLSFFTKLVSVHKSFLFSLTHKTKRPLNGTTWFESYCSVKMQNVRKQVNLSQFLNFVSLSTVFAYTSAVHNVNSCAAHLVQSYHDTLWTTGRQKHFVICVGMMSTVMPQS